MASESVKRFLRIKPECYRIAVIDPDSVDAQNIFHRHFAIGRILTSGCGIIIYRESLDYFLNAFRSNRILGQQYPVCGGINKSQSIGGKVVFYDQSGSFVNSDSVFFSSFYRDIVRRVYTNARLISALREIAFGNPFDPDDFRCNECNFLCSSGTNGYKGG